MMDKLQTWQEKYQELLEQGAKKPLGQIDPKD